MTAFLYLANWLELLVKIAAGLTAVAAIWSKGIKPALHFVRRIGDGVEYVQGQMQNNGGSTLKDAVDRTEARVDTIVERLDQIDSRVEFLEAVHRKQDEVDRIVAANASRLASRRPPLHLPPTEES